MASKLGFCLPLYTHVLYGTTSNIELKIGPNEIQ